MTYISNYELVRRDLLDREQDDLRRLGTPAVVYSGRSAILDAYQDAIDLVCYLRQVIEEMQIGGQLFASEPPGYAQ